MAAGESAIILTAGAAVLFLGVLASFVFERFRVPDVMLLMIAGIVMGPVLGLVDASSFGSLAQIFATLALVVILFEGGLDLNVRALRERVGLTSALLVLSYFTTAVAIAAVCVLGLGFAWPLGLLFGFVMAPLSSSILISLLGRLRVLPETRALLTVESALGDVLAVLATFTLADAMAGGNVGAGAILQSLSSSFLAGGVLAVSAGVVWLVALRFMKGRPYTYLVTFAVAVLIFGTIESIGGNGVVAVLVFALVLGNADLFVGRVPGAVAYELDTRIRWFHAEMAFFVRTFFFVYLGLLVTLGGFTLKLVAVAVAVVLAILLVRGGVVLALVKERPEERQDRSYLTFLIGRGLASAALASVPLVVSLSEGTAFSDLAFAVILLTNLTMTVFILAKEHGPGEGAEVEAALVEFGDYEEKGAPERNAKTPPSREG